MNRNSSSRQRLGDLRAGAPGDHDRLDPRQLAFLVVGELAEQELADDRAEDRVAEELEPLVRGEPVIGPRGMRERLAKEVGATERVAEHVLALARAVGSRPVESSAAWSDRGFAQRICVQES